MMRPPKQGLYLAAERRRSCRGGALSQPRKPAVGDLSACCRSLKAEPNLANSPSAARLPRGRPTAAKRSVACGR